MELTYYDLISSSPITLAHIGSIKSPTLRDVDKITYQTYVNYIAFLRMNPEDFFNTFYPDKKVDIEDIMNTTKFDLVRIDESFRSVILSALNFFFVEDFQYINEPGYECFVVLDENQNITHAITKQTYNDVVNIILQRVHIEIEKDIVDDLSKVKNKLGKKIYEKIFARRKQFQKAKANNPDYDYANIIASIAAYNSSLNWINIWDITVYQLYDLFERTAINDRYESSKLSVSVWGDKEKKFKFGAWHNNIFSEKESQDANK